MFGRKLIARAMAAMVIGNAAYCVEGCGKACCSGAKKAKNDENHSSSGSKKENPNFDKIYPADYVKQEGLDAELDAMDMPDEPQMPDDLNFDELFKNMFADGDMGDMGDIMEQMKGLLGNDMDGLGDLLGGMGGEGLGDLGDIMGNMDSGKTDPLDDLDDEDDNMVCDAKTGMCGPAPGMCGMNDGKASFDQMKKEFDNEQCGAFCQAQNAFNKTVESVFGNADNEVESSEEPDFDEL